jgi:uncharacterized protein (TIGR02271 family)
MSLAIDKDRRQRQQGSSMQTAICSFDSRAQAERAADLLIERGLRRDFVYMKAGQTDAAGATSAADRSGPGFFLRLFSDLFGDPDASAKASHYDDAVARGETVLVVDVADDRELAIVREAMSRIGGSVDVEGAATAQGGATAPTASPATAGASMQAPPAARQAPSALEESTVVPVVEEALTVGKRTVATGGIRVVKRIVETPVSEAVRVLEERAVVERRAVDRPATEADFASFPEGTLEIRERTEEPVVAKAARVVEEVIVGKEVREHDETVTDSVRRTDVDVEPIGSGAPARDAGSRAVRETSTAAPRPTDPRP